MAESVRQSSETLESFLKGDSYKSSGFAAVTAVGPPPYVVADLQRGPDGKMKVVYIDFQTKQPVQSIDGYTVLTSNAYFTPDGKVVEPPPGTPPPPEATTVKEVLFNKQGGGDSPAAQGRGQEARRGMARAQNTNFGYMDKPAGMGLLSAMPGVPGMAAKAINTAVNANNVAAVNAARRSMEVPEMSTKENVKGSLKDRQGFVGRYGVNGQEYSVGLEAEDAEGRTTLTPNEARARGLAMGGLTEVADQTGLPQGVVTKGVSAVRSFLSNVFGSTPVNQVAPNMVNPVAREVADVAPSNARTALSPVRDATPVSPVTDSAGAVQPTKIAGRTLTPGAGLANLAPVNQRPGLAAISPNDENANRVDDRRGSMAADTNSSPVGFVGRYGDLRPNPPQQSLIDNVRESVGNVYGATGKEVEVAGTSGTGEYGSARHRSPDRVGFSTPGAAMDFDVSVDGKKSTDEQAQRDVAMDFAARNPEAGIGYGPGYMTDESGLPGRMHLDTYGDPKSWGAKNTRKNMDPTFAGNLDFARETGIGPTPTFGAPTPTPRPDYETPSATVDARESVSSVAGPALGFIGRMNNPSPMKTVEQNGPARTTTVNTGRVSISKTGNAAWRNNNPGNLEDGSFAQSQGALSTNPGRFAVFNDKQAGLSAMSNLLSGPNYNDLTIAEAISKYAPPTENNTARYVGVVTSALGLPETTKMSDLSPSQRQAMTAAMTAHEGNAVGTSTATLIDRTGLPDYMGNGLVGSDDTPSETSARSMAPGKNAPSKSASEKASSQSAGGSKTNKSESSKNSGGIGKSSHSSERGREAADTGRSQNKSEKGSKESSKGSSGIGRSSKNDNRNTKSEKSEKSSRSAGRESSDSKSGKGAGKSSGGGRRAA